MWFSIGVFFFSLAGIAGLFAFKEWEGRNERTMAPRLRETLDAWALHLKDLGIALQADLEKLPPELVHLSRIAIHEVALGTAALLRFLESQAHRLADFVSHKHAFQRRAPRSEFLKKVTEHKNSNGDYNGDSKLDTTE